MSQCFLVVLHIAALLHCPNFLLGGLVICALLWSVYISMQHWRHQYLLIAPRAVRHLIVQQDGCWLALLANQQSVPVEVQHYYVLADQLLCLRLRVAISAGIPVVPMCDSRWSFPFDCGFFVKKIVCQWLLYWRLGQCQYAFCVVTEQQLGAGKFRRLLTRIRYG